MLTPEQRHRHSGLAGDGDKIKYSDLAWAPQIHPPYMNHTSRGAWGTGTMSITWVWFRPSIVRIYASMTGTYGSHSYGVATSSSNQFVHSTFWNVANDVQTTDNAAIIYLKVDTGGFPPPQVKADFLWFTDDWFDLNFSISDGTAIFSYECE